ncbi:unnamed protein product [Miscanthus lutarioriparius]|uniref:tryptophan synthase n=1 Tax=Miscanthus lutarioriparius TaxID=422564 RepID=A0A811NKR0_9POAL|nr:unnamed protein product [Miscanthus lutarioriparius]
MAFALKAAATGTASFSAAGPRRGAAPTGRVSFRGAAPAPAVAVGRGGGGRRCCVGGQAQHLRHLRRAQGAGEVLSENLQTAFVPFITAGDPDLATTAKALKILDACGSDVIELGVPYSDPLADGPVIQAAATRALAKGTTFEDVISMVKGVIPELSCPVALFTYYNPILKRGIPKFMSIVKEAGVHGLVVPDVPLEETDVLRSEAAKNNLELVSTVGVTGTRTNVSGKVQSLLQDIKKVTEKPVAVGFGVSTPEHVQQIAGWGADGVIIGSAMVRLLGEAASPEEGLKKLEELAKNLKAALS